MRKLAFAGLLLFPVAIRAQSETERGEVAWKAGTTFAMQGNADSSLAAFYRARDVAQSVHDSSLLSAALRGAAEVHRIYLGCADSSFVLLQRAVAVSPAGDRSAGQLLIRQLATARRLPEARALHARLYADVSDEVPRSISRESIGFLSGQAAIQQAAGQHQAALASLQSARLIADRLANGDNVDSAKAKPLIDVTSQNYWVTFEMGQLMLASKTAGVMNVAQGKSLLNAVAAATDEPEEGNERRFPVLRLADRLAVKAWRCTMNGERCVIPPPRTCRP